MATTDTEIGWIYVLYNEAMPGYTKIGFTKKESVETRVAELSNWTGVPLPFQIAYAAKVKSPKQVEDALHSAFAPNRPNKKREFFLISPEQAIPIIKLLEIEDITKQALANTEATFDPEEKAAIDSARRRRPNFDFEQLGIPVGAELIFALEDHPRNNTSVRVVSNKKVEYNGQQVSLTRATSDILDRGYDVQPSPYWKFNGKYLISIYNEKYNVGQDTEE